LGVLLDLSEPKTEAIGELYPTSADSAGTSTCKLLFYMVNNLIDTKTDYGVSVRLVFYYSK